MRRSNHPDRVRKESAHASDNRRDRRVIMDPMNRFFGMNPVGKDRDEITLQTCERYLEYARRNSNPPAA